MEVTAKQIAKMIDHSLLNPIMTAQDIKDGCAVAAKYDVATVCVKPCDVVLAKSCLEGTDVLTTTVIGFPHGSNLTSVKVFEAKEAIAQGCKELDMVLNIGRLLGGDYDYVEKDIKAVCEEAHKSGVIVKVILENAYLTPELITKACKLCESAGADFVKTSTGYAPSGATPKDLINMRASVSDKIQVKAAGGVRTLDGALKVKAIGGSRFGCTVTAQIVEDARKREQEGTLKLPEEIGDTF